jgi:hypothetical protein
MGREQADRGHRQQMVETAKRMDKAGQKTGIAAVPGMGERNARREQ